MTNLILIHHLVTHDRDPCNSEREMLAKTSDVLRSIFSAVDCMHSQLVAKGARAS